VLRLTPFRLVVLARYAVQPDRVWKPPRASIRDVQLAGDAVRLSFTGERGPDVLTLTGWTGRAAFGSALRDVAAVADALRTWLAALGNLPPRPHSHR
jgi:hypothetical protein